MTCQVCNKEFQLSLEWLKLNDYKSHLDENKLIMCDECVLYILHSRKYLLEAELDAITRKIRKLKGE